MALTQHWVRAVKAVLGVIVLILCIPSVSLAQASRMGGNIEIIPASASSRFPAVAYDPVSDSYLVVTGIAKVSARFVSGDGVALGAADSVNTGGAGAAGVACAAAANACLVAWIEEPSNIMGRLIRNNGGNLQYLTAPFLVNANGVNKLTSTAPSVAASASGEFLVGWTEVSPWSAIKAQRVTGNGAPTGPEIVISGAVAGITAMLPSLTYNSRLDEYGVAYQYEPSAINQVALQRVKPGTGALIGERSIIYSGSFAQYPEIAYNSNDNQYLAITWGGPLVTGGLADGNGQPLTGPLPIAIGGLGDGIGLAYNPVSNTYLAVYLSTQNPEIWAVEIDRNGVPGAQFQLTAWGALDNVAFSTQPSAAGSTKDGRWLGVNSAGYQRIVGNMAQTGTVSGPPPPPPCVSALSDTGATIPGTSFTGGLIVTTSTACSWTAASQASWLAISSSGGDGSGSLRWAAQPNRTGASRSGSIVIGGKTFTVTQAALIVTTADFNADSHVDLVWQNRSTGDLAVWRMNGFGQMNGVSLTPGNVGDRGWKIVGAVDLDKDGSTDLLWQHDLGWLSVWWMRGERMVSGELLTQTPLSDLNWRVVGTGDVDRDGWADIIWQHTDGRVSVWYMRGRTYLAGQVIVEPLSDRGWRIAGVADLNKDGHVDLLWHHAITGHVAVWMMNRMILADAVLLAESVADTNWAIVGLGDFDADGDVDVLWQNNATGGLAAWVMNGLVVDNGLSLDVAVPDTNWKIVSPH